MRSAKRHFAPSAIRRLLGAAACSLALQASAQTCVAVGAWSIPDGSGPRRVAFHEVLREVVDQPVVLLGESHERAEHHRWQLHTLANLHAQRPDMVLGFEMFPRSVQPLLDRWVAGELTQRELLEGSRWFEVWGFDPAHYLPLFHFARMHAIPMLALNVERTLVRRVGREGFDAVPEAVREGVGRPEPASPDYLRELHSVYLQHAAQASADPNDPGFHRFVAGQQVWDRAMAEAIRRGLERYPGRQVVAVMGRGHTGPGAVPHQLRALGVLRSAVLLPWDEEPGCTEPQPGTATAVFGVVSERRDEEARPRLGIALGAVSDAGALVERVAPGSIAAQTGLRGGDRLTRIAGQRVRRAGDVHAAIARQAPGTWLPLRVQRDGAELELVAKFPR
jgi:uncharacterized iron-regulated protein